MNRGALAGLGLVGALAVAVVALAVSGVSNQPGGNQSSGGPSDVAGNASSSAAGAFAGPTTCLPCHAEVVAEWQASMHAQAFTDPQVRQPGQADNFRKTECLPCHAPAPIFAHGIEPGSRVLARALRRVDGVDCLACHLTDQGMAGARTGATGACNPVFRAEVSTHQMCAACHDQHNTNQEWLASPAATRGDDCRTCHMPRVERPGAEAGGPRVGRSHRFLGGRDRDFTLAGIDLQHRLEDGHLVVTLTNEFAGHHLPTDSRNRALDLVITLFDPSGRPLPLPAGYEPLDYQTQGSARLRFRNPYRSQGRPTSQILAGESATLSVPVGNAVRAVIQLLYKLEPFVPDEQAHWSLEIEVPLRS